MFESIIIVCGAVMLFCLWTMACSLRLTKLRGQAIQFRRFLAMRVQELSNEDERNNKPYDIRWRPEIFYQVHISEYYYINKDSIYRCFDPRLFRKFNEERILNKWNDLSFLDPFGIPKRWVSSRVG